MDAFELFNANLALIDEVIDFVCRRARLNGADAEDFASVARLALIENDYAVLRKWEGRSSLGGYLTAVLQRLLIDERVRVHGRWRASIEARRMGPAGIVLETILHRDGRSLDEALVSVRTVDPHLTRGDVESMARRLPARAARPRTVDLALVADTAVASDRADARLLRREAETFARRAASIVRTFVDSLPAEERLILDFRFAREMSTPAIARALQIPQRTLYRRLEALLERMRGALADAGLDDDALALALEADREALDFGFARWRDEAAFEHHSLHAVVEEPT